MTAKRNTNYIPVTMDELMARFVTNMERTQCKAAYDDAKQILFNSDYSELEPIRIEQGVVDSFKALQALLLNNTIDLER